MNYIFDRNEKLAASLVKSLKERNFDAYYCGNSSEMIQLVLSLIPDKASISFGGSMTIRDSGLVRELKECKRFCVLDRDEVKPEERKEFMKAAMFCDFFLASANAITEDGVIVNVDGTGNRVAPMIFGPDNVIVVVGMNKVVKNYDDAIARARNYAAPVNAQRFDIKTPCKNLGKCMNCKSPDSICSTIVTHRLSKPQGRIKVILVNEELGF